MSAATGCELLPALTVDSLLLRTVGFVQRLWHWQGPPPPKGVDGSMLWPGKIDSELATSRDGLTFARSTGRQPLLSVGRDGHWTSAFKWAIPSLVHFGDRELLFYAGRNYNHNLETRRGVEYAPGFRSGIAAVAWRRDGMIALETTDDSYATRREATTLPLQFGEAGQAVDGWLELNLDTGAGGSCAVEILDAATQRPLPGLSLAEAVPLVANSVQARAQWRGAPSLKSAGAVGRPVRLRFVLQAAKLFGFRFARTGA